MKNSTITSVQGNGTWEGPHGLLYSYEVRLANGDHILLNAKTGNAFQIGDDLSYELTGKTDRNQTPYAKKVNPQFTAQRPSAPASGGGDDRQKSIEIQMSFKAAVEYCIAKGENIGNAVEYAKFIYDQLQDAKRSF